MDDIRTQAAVDWLIRQRDPGFTAWSEFTDWLEADPLNADAYAELAVRDDLVAERMSQVAAPVTEAAAPRRLPRRAVVGGIAALAASVAIAFGAFQLQTAPSLYSVATAPGVQQTVTLAGGTVITLNGASVLQLDRNNPRFAKLDRGEARFAVVHDSDRPFKVRVGGAELMDLGTVFNVIREGGATEVGVAEGVVMYNPAGEAIRLGPGRTLKAIDGSGSINVGAAGVASIGAWQQGRLVYENAPLAAVARDLSRNVGKPVRADAAVAGRSVTAVVQLPKDREQLPRRLERLLDITVRQTPEGWILTT